MQPTVSVIMPAYNSEKYIGSAIQSVLMQTYINIELIISNDASIDNTKEIIKLFKDKRLVYLENSKNKGISENRNICLSYANGEYIAVMDNDDISMPTRIEYQIKFLEANPEIDVVGTYVCLIDDRNKIIGFMGSYTSDEEIKKRIYWRNPISSPSIMARAEWLKKWQYRPGTGRIDDHDLFLRANKSSCYAILPEYLYCYRVYYKQNYLKKYIKAQLDSINNKRRYYREYDMSIPILLFSCSLNILKLYYGYLKTLFQPHSPGIRPRGFRERIYWA